MTVSTISMVDGPALLDIVLAATATVMEVSQAELSSATALVADLEADSLAVIEIVEVTEEELRALGVVVRVDDMTLARLTTLADLVTALKGTVS